MLAVLTQDILPVFAMLALGFVLGRTRLVARAEAAALNRVGFLVLQPPLLFLLISGLDPQRFDAGALGLYAGSELVAFVTSAFVARFVFRRDVRESFLLGMTVVFVNSLLYIGPISVLIYGPEGALPITAIVAWDATVSFAFFILGMEILTRQSSAAATMKRIALNPILLTIVISTAVKLAGVPVPEPFLTAADFAGAAAAPVILFALGAVLSSHSLVPSPTVAGFAALKLLAFPILVWSAFALLSPGNAWEPFFVLNAAGPSGAMAFSLAMLYKVRTDAIAPVIIWTSVLSLVSLAWLA